MFPVAFRTRHGRCIDSCIWPLFRLVLMVYVSPFVFRGTFFSSLRIISVLPQAGIWPSLLFFFLSSSTFLSLCPGGSCMLCFSYPACWHGMAVSVLLTHIIPALRPLCIQYIQFYSSILMREWVGQVNEFMT